MVNQKNAFWQALIFTIIVFSIGLLIGYGLENNRAEQTQRILLKSEINLLDEQIRNKGINDLSIECALAKQSVFTFADEIYSEARLLEEYDDSNKFIDVLTDVHKRYDLLRMSLWLESLNLKKKCGEDFHTIVYIFEYNSKNIQTNAKQSSLSRLLIDLKEKHESEILLIPIAGNLKLKSVNLVKEKYNVDNLPTIIVDENKVIGNIPTFTELENMIFNTNKEYK